MTHAAPEMDKLEIRQRVWKELREVARPDSRFHWNFAEFIPEFEGSDHCADVVRRMAAYSASNLIFITPDNNLVRLRQYAIQDRKPSPYDTIVDCIVTPTRVVNVPPIHSKPRGVFWDRIPRELREQIPPLQELYESNSPDDHGNPSS